MISYRAACILIYAYKHNSFVTQDKLYYNTYIMQTKTVIGCINWQAHTVFELSP